MCAHGLFLPAGLQLACLGRSVGAIHTQQQAGAGAAAAIAGTEDAVDEGGDAELPPRTQVSQRSLAPLGGGAEATAPVGAGRLKGDM